MGASEPTRRTPLVLVIDDDATQRVLVQETLRQAGFDTEEAENGTDGIARTAELRPDLVILDVVMPDLDGFTVCRGLRGNPKTQHIPILMITGLEDEKSIARAFEAGATNFLTKPINWALLPHHIRYILRSSAVEDELRAAKRAAEAHSRSRTEILANMSHELRTPLNSIIGFAELTAKQSLGPVNITGYVDFANDIKEAGHHLLGMINDILELSKIEAGKSEILEDVLNLKEVIESSVRVMKLRLEQADLTLQVQLETVLPRFRADERKVKQMILNLLSNAIKFTPADGEIRLAVSIDDSGDLILEVRDNGIGIAARDFERALEPFSQVDSGLNRKYPGTGLGLPLTKLFVELHGGSMTLESALGEGTTVSLRFPAWRFIDAGKKPSGQPAAGRKGQGSSQGSAPRKNASARRQA